MFYNIKDKISVYSGEIHKRLLNRVLRMYYKCTFDSFREWSLFSLSNKWITPRLSLCCKVSAYGTRNVKIKVYEAHTNINWSFVLHKENIQSLPSFLCLRRIDETSWLRSRCFSAKSSFDLDRYGWNIKFCFASQEFEVSKITWDLWRLRNCKTQTQDVFVQV